MRALKDDSLRFITGASRTTQPQQNMPVRLQITGGKASYTRTVQDERGASNVGTEQGTGTIAGDGATTFTGGWSGTRDRYTATYTVDVTPPVIS